MSYEKITVPASGEKITMGADGHVNVPDNPILPFIEGDGTGRDITRASMIAWNAAVEKAYGGKRKVEWMEVYAGDYSFGEGAFEWGLYPRILFQKGELAMYLPFYDPGDDPTEHLITLEPEGEHRFRMTGDNGNGELLVFEMEPDGSVKRAVFEGDFLYPHAR